MTAGTLAKLQQSGKTFTQVYADYMKAQNDLTHLKHENAQLRHGMQEVVEEVAVRASEFRHMERAYETVVEEGERLRVQLERVEEERTRLKGELERVEREWEGAKEEMGWLKQAHQDAVVQIRGLLAEVEVLQGRMPAEPSVVSLNLSGGDITAQTVITQRLVVIRNIEELQAKNQELLAVVRKLSAEKERNDLAQKEEQLHTLRQQYAEMTEQVSVLCEERKKNEVLLQSMVNERDMYKSIVESSSSAAMGRSGRGGAGMEGVASSPPRPGSSLLLTPGTVLDGRSDTPLPGNHSVLPSSETYDKMLKEVQTNFENFRKEVAADTKVLRTELQQAQKDASDYRVQSAQAKAQVQFLQDRVNMLNGTVDQQNKEISDFRARHSTLLANVAQFEHRLKESHEDATVLRGQLDKAKQELAHLRAEKQLFETSETRYQEERTLLVQERNRVNELLRHLQTVHADVERNEAEARRKLQEEKESLEFEVTKLRMKAADDQADIKAHISRKEAELKEWQMKFEKQNAELMKARESVASQASKLTHLEGRVQELSADLLKREEEVRKMRLNQIMAGSPSTPQRREAGEAASSSDVEVEALRQELEEARQEIEKQRQHAETFMEISKSAEDKLASNNEAFQRYREENEARLAELDAENTQLRQQLDQYTEKLDQLQKNLDDAHVASETLRAEMQAEIDRLSSKCAELAESEAQAVANQAALKEDALRQQRIAEEASTSYESELLKHAKDIEQLSTIKNRLSTLQNEKIAMISQVQNAEENLRIAQESWGNQKTLLESQQENLKKRVEDLSSQNNLLYSQIDQLNEELNKLKRPTIDVDAVTSENAEDQKIVEDLREVIKFLRREKQVVEYEMDASQQEARRLQQQLEHVQRNLQETQTQLVDERYRQSHGVLLSEVEHADMQAKIRESDLLRESNVTLRDENTRNKTRVSELEKTVKKLNQDLMPLKEQVQVLQAELDARGEEIRIISEENERWKSRTQQILAKYDKIDPVEHRQLVEAFENLKQESASKATELEQQVSEKDGSLKQAEEKVIMMVYYHAFRFIIS